VENVLYRFDGVAEAAVIGAPDERWGEVGIAYIVPAEGAAIDADGLIGFCRDNLAGYKVPKAVRVVETLPRNATGKILKRELRARQGEER
jgi:fatty-acyl-CoA synthase